MYEFYYTENIIYVVVCISIWYFLLTRVAISKSISTFETQGGNSVYIDKKSGEQGGTALCNKLLEEHSFKSANFKAFM